MTKLCLVLLLATGAASAHAQTSVDTTEERQTLQTMVDCLAKARPRWAHKVLSQPYLGDAQARAAAEVMTGRDSCMVGNGEKGIIFRNSGVAGGLAESFLRANLDRADFAQVSARMPTITPLNASEEFALCLAGKNAAAARSLVQSPIGSSSENQAARELTGEAGACVAKGAQLKIDLQSLRALMATALYRSVTAVLAPRTALKS